jgi:hypothetical protein
MENEAEMTIKNNNNKPLERKKAGATEGRESGGRMGHSGGLCGT